MKLLRTQTSLPISVISPAASTVSQQVALNAERSSFLRSNVARDLSSILRAGPGIQISLTLRPPFELVYSGHTADPAMRENPTKSGVGTRRHVDVFLVWMRPVSKRHRNPPKTIPGKVSRDHPRFYAGETQLSGQGTELGLPSALVARRWRDSPKRCLRISFLRKYRTEAS